MENKVENSGLTGTETIESATKPDKAASPENADTLQAADSKTEPAEKDEPIKGDGESTDNLKDAPDSAEAVSSESEESAVEDSDSEPEKSVDGDGSSDNECGAESGDSAADGEGKPKKTKKKSKKKKDSKGTDWLKIGLLAAVVVLLAVCAVLLCKTYGCISCTSCGKNEKVALGSDFFDDEAQEGYLPTLTDEEIQAELDRIVADGMVNVSIASVIEMDDGKSKALANIENIQANKYYLSVDIVLDDTGETVYSSKGLKPGQYIDYISLKKELDAGEYPATARFTAYDPETFNVEGHVAIKVYIVVKS